MERVPVVVEQVKYENILHIYRDKIVFVSINTEFPQFQGNIE